MADVQVVGLGHGTGDTSERFVGLVGAEHASAGDATEQTQQLGRQGGGLQLVDGGGQLVADVAEGVSAGAELREVVGGIREATMQDRHDLLVGSGPAGGSGSPPPEVPQVLSAEDLLFGGGDGVEEGHAHAGAAGTGVQGSVALDDAALNPLRLLEDTFRGVLKKFGAGYKV